MGLALLSQAKNWISSAYASADPDVLTEAVNAIRRELYAWYSEMNLFVTAEECFEVQRFCEDCRSCAETYRGITLPREFAAVEAMWFDSRPVKLFDRWRQFQQGMKSACDCGLSKYDMGDDFATERDIAQRCYLRIMALMPDDLGKKLVLRGKTIHGDAEIEVCLSHKPQLTELPWLSIDRAGGVSKDVTKGRVLIAEDNGRILSIYAPDETCPAYKRVKITGLPSDCQHVLIRSARNYVEVFDDKDVVEHDNQRAWEAMARALRIDRKQDRSRDDIQSQAIYISQAKAMLLGDKSRAEGKSARTDLRISTPKLQNYSLGRTGGRRRW